MTQVSEARRGILRVPHPALSLWQSCVREVVAKHVAGGDIGAIAVAQNPLVQQADADASGLRQAGTPIEPRTCAALGSDDSPFQIALAHAHDVVHQLGSFAESIGRYDRADPLFTECNFEFMKYYWLARRQPQYRDWKKSSRGLGFGVIDTRLPSTARVAVIGDWGTGMEDAALLLEQLLEQRPDALIHLGDVYYSGTPLEFQYNFRAVLNRVLQAHPELGRGPRIYAVPGNHDYYAGGGAFYDLIDSINLEHARQSASYFCLRTEDGAVQILGMDTGFNDREPATPFNKAYVAPAPPDSEIAWLCDKLDDFEGRTILLSHHQPFTAHSRLSGPESGQLPYLNRHLLDAFAGRLKKVEAWLWGHEHSLVVFEDDQFGIHKGRLIGCSAFETAPEDDPYAIRFPEVAVKSVRLSKTGPWYNHGCAVIDLGRSSLTYYQMAAWTDRRPSEGLLLAQLAEEELDLR